MNAMTVKRMIKIIDMNIIDTLMMNQMTVKRMIMTSYIIISNTYLIMTKYDKSNNSKEKDHDNSYNHLQYLPYNDEI